MKREITKLLALSLAVTLLFVGLAGCIPVKTAVEQPLSTEGPAATEEEVFPSWNEEAPALNTLIEFVEAVTDENSSDFIPVDRRIAVFDMDGTVYAELFPTYLEYYLMAWRILADPTDRKSVV